MNEQEEALQLFSMDRSFEIFYDIFLFFRKLSIFSDLSKVTISLRTDFESMKRTVGLERRTVVQEQRTKNQFFVIFYVLRCLSEHKR